MKIRIQDNSIRYRLTMSEVAAFSRDGVVESCTSFEQDEFRYVLKTKSHITGLTATFENNTITMWVPAKDARGWAKSTEIGFSNTVALEGGKELSLLLEKDFACLDETGEDQSDNYPNPRAKA